MRLPAISLACLLLVGCGNSTILTSNRNMVVMPPDELFECPRVEYPTNVEELTDLDVATLILLLHGTNERCRININAIKQFLESARRVTEEQTR